MLSNSLFVVQVLSFHVMLMESTDLPYKLLGLNVYEGCTYLLELCFFTVCGYVIKGLELYNCKQISKI